MHESTGGSLVCKVLFFLMSEAYENVDVLSRGGYCNFVDALIPCLEVEVSAYGNQGKQPNQVSTRGKAPTSGQWR